MNDHFREAWEEAVKLYRAEKVESTRLRSKIDQATAILNEEPYTNRIKRALACLAEQGKV